MQRFNRTSPSSARATALCVFLVAGLASSPGPALADSRYQLRIHPAEARATLNAFIHGIRIRQREGRVVPRQDLDRATKLLLSYRTGKRPSPLSISNAPFTGALILERFEEIWKSEYESNRAREYEKNVVRLPLETLFDEFMSMIVNDAVPKSMRNDAEKIGKCMATKALAGRVEADAAISNWTRRACPLDPSPHRFASVGILKLLWMKATCGLPTPSPCFARRSLYDFMKKDLLAARRTPAIREAAAAEFRKRFPPEFRKEFLGEIGGRLRGVASLVAAKFGGEVNAALWSPYTALVDALILEEAAGSSSGDTRNVHVTMKDFSEGLRADAGLAALLVQSDDPKLRGVAAPLFYAAANRLLLMTGGERARFDGRRLLLEKGDRFDPAAPGRPPVLAREVFGGWGVEREAGEVRFAPWDWAEYDPARKTRLFPAEFVAGQAGRPGFVAGEAGVVPPVQSLDDLVDLISAVSLFFDQTRSGSRLAPFMGSEEELDGILKPDSAVLFPREGRMLMIALAGAALRNIVAPGGHIAETRPGSEHGPAGIAFYETVEFSGRGSPKAPVVSVAKLIVAAARLQRALRGDPMVPESLSRQLDELDQAVVNAGLALLATGTEADGSFRERLMTPREKNRRLMSTIQGLEAMIQIYKLSSMPIVKTSILSSLGYVDRVWGERVAPARVEGTSQPLTPSELWRLVGFWDEHEGWLRAQDRLRGTDWFRWENRFEMLRDVLNRQIEEKEGPRPLSNG